MNFDSSPSQNQNQLNNIFSDYQSGQEPNIRKAKFIVSQKRKYTLEFDHNIEMQELKIMIQKAAHLKKNSFYLICNGKNYTNYTDETFESFFPDQKLVVFTLELIKGEEEYDETELLLQIKSPCPEHEYKFLLYYCFDCGKSICSECITNDHIDHKIQDKCFYLLPSKYLVEKMFENWSKKPYEDYQISVDLNEYKNKLNNVYFKQLFDMLKEIQKKCNVLIDKYNLINQESLSNLRDSVRDIKVSCIKALDEYKNIINIKDIINDQEVFVDFDHTYKDLGNKQKEKFKENLVKFQELNKGVSILVENLINDVCKKINDALLKALDNRQYEDVEQKINLKLIMPVNKDDIINEISDKKIKMKKNKIHPRNTVNNYNQLVNKIAAGIEQKLDKKIANPKGRNTMTVQENINNDIFMENSNDKNEDNNDNVEQMSNGKNYNNMNNEFNINNNSNSNIDSNINAQIFENNTKKEKAPNSQNINNESNIPEFNLNPNNKIFDLNQNDNPNSSEIQKENIFNEKNENNKIDNPNPDYNKNIQNNSNVNPFFQNTNTITNHNEIIKQIENDKNINQNDNINNNIFSSLVDSNNNIQNTNNNIFNLNPDYKINNKIDFFSDNKTSQVVDNNMLNNNKRGIFSNTSSLNNNESNLINSNNDLPNQEAINTNKNIESNIIRNPFSFDNLNNNNSQILPNKSSPKKLNLSSPFAQYANNNNNLSFNIKNENINSHTNNNAGVENFNNKINENDNKRNNNIKKNKTINKIDSKYLSKLAFKCKTILEEANESESEVKVQKEKNNYNIEYYLKKPFILSPIPTTDKVKIITDDENDENILTIAFPENLNISSFLYNCAYCNHKGKIYISGGVVNPDSSSNSFSNKFFMIDLSKTGKDGDTKPCIIELSPMVYCRSNHTMIEYNNEIYAVGGDGLNSVEKYDISKDAWIEIASMIRKRSNAMLTADNGYLYAFFGKGENGEYPGSIERINIQSDNSVWEMILFSNPSNIDTKLYGCGVYQADDELIYFIGGKCNKQTIDDIFFFNLTDRRFDVSNAKLKWKQSFRENRLFELGKKIVQITDENFFGVYLTIVVN